MTHDLFLFRRICSCISSETTGTIGQLINGIIFSSNGLSEISIWSQCKYYASKRLDFLKVRFGIRTFPACFARFVPTYIVVGGWPWCDWGCVIILANEKRIFK